MAGKLFVGTSGFSYSDWIGKFYPKDLPPRQWLEFYSQYFSTLELNNTFYRLPQPQTFINWRQRTPKNFLFSIKANQKITHFKKLAIEPKDWQIFWQRISLLKEKLGVILFQFPPSFKKDSRRLIDFLKNYHSQTRFAFEFRHQSWFDKEIFQILRTHNCSLVFHDSLAWPQPPLISTADFVYLRFHDKEVLYNYEYSSSQLKEWAKKIEKWLEQKLDVFTYFNNDPDGFAVKNAEQLCKFFSPSLNKGQFVKKLRV